MHPHELVELAAVVSAHGPALIHSGQQIPAENIEQYWIASKVRLDRWAWRLRRFADCHPRQRQAEWPKVRGVAEEVLSSEMLTRTWAAVLWAYDCRRGGDEAAPAARSVMIGHMEARHRVLTLMVHSPGVDAEAAVRLNRLRRRVERWTDLLIGHLSCGDDVSALAFDPRRARDFAEDLRQRDDLQDRRLTWPLLLDSLRSAFRPESFAASPNHDVNARIAASILSCFPADVFNSTGLVHSVWLLRLTSIAEDTQGMIDDLLSGQRGGSFTRRAGAPRRHGG